MPLTPGTRIGPYEVVGSLGAGGMGEVYRARDSKLNREVALKVLPASVAADPERLARFRREAQVLAALNHPNIAHVHGFEDSGDVHALVMELVEGSTLADRIGRGPIPLVEALPIAKQIAEALETAHEQGIVHRDLKPANVKVREDGVVKVLDFGLAKALGTDPSGVSGGDPNNSPTLTAGATALGMIIGTAAYMAPEQAKGRTVDRRADIWAFGVVLFEMVTGRRGYEAEDISETLAAVLTREVDWAALPASTPRALKTLIKDCLVRDPKERLRDIGDARRELQRMISGGPEPAAEGIPADARAPQKGSRIPWIVAAAAILAAIASTWLALRPRIESTRPVTRSEVELKQFSGFIAVSADGTKAAYTVADGKAGIYIALRLLDQFEAKRIPGTENGAWPIFSPDGNWIAFGDTAGPKIKKIALAGGTATPIGDASLVNGGTWGPDDTIVFAGSKGLMKIPATGGKAEPVTTLDAAKKETGHNRPQFLPDGKHVLFTVTGAEGPQFAILDLASGKYQTIGKTSLNGKYLASGHLIYLRDRTLFAVPFDLAKTSVLGGEVPVAEGVSPGPQGGGDFAVSENGVLAYFAAGAEGAGTTLAWSDRTGKITQLPGQSTQQWGTGSLSADGRFVANVISTGTGNRDVWIFDVTRGIPTRLTTNGNFDYPTFSYDGKHVFVGGTLDSKTGVYRIPADSSGKPELLLTTPGTVQIGSVAPAGKSIVFTETAVDKPPRLMVVDIGADGKAGTARPLHEGATAVEVQGMISPDGRWIAYVSQEAGPPDVYVHAYPVAGAKIRISTNAAQRPRWSRDGRELFFWAGTPSTAFMAVDIPNGDASHPGTPRKLFEYLSGTTSDVTPDKNKFLLEMTSTSEGVRLALVTNWFEELKTRVPVKR